MGDKIKGSSQEFQFNQEERASILSHIELIDLIVLLDKDEIDLAVNQLKPKVLIFGKEFQNTTSIKIKKAIQNQVSLKNEVKFLTGQINYASTELLDNDQYFLKEKKNKQFCEAIKIQGISFKVLLIILKR